GADGRRLLGDAVGRGQVSHRSLYVEEWQTDADVAERPARQPRVRPVGVPRRQANRLQLLHGEPAATVVSRSPRRRQNRRAETRREAERSARQKTASAGGGGSLEGRTRGRRRGV